MEKFDFSEALKFVDNPIALCGLGFIVFLSFFKLIIKSGLAPNVSRHSALSHKILNYTFAFSLVAICAAFGLEFYRESNAYEIHRDIISQYPNETIGTSEDNREQINEVKRDDSLLANTSATILVAPQNGVTVSQPYYQNWRFKWDIPRDQNKVLQYHLRVFGSGAAYPAVDVMLEENEYIVPGRCTTISDWYLNGWTWQVRTQFLNEHWGEWSKQFVFNVRPLDKESLCTLCSEYFDCE